jgi:hypothetical protein
MGKEDDGGEEATRVVQFGVDVARCEQPEVADLDEVAGQDVQQEASDEVGQGGSVQVPRFLVAKTDDAIIDGDEALVGDADPDGCSGRGS